MFRVFFSTNYPRLRCVQTVRNNTVQYSTSNKFREHKILYLSVLILKGKRADITQVATTTTNRIRQTIYR